MDPSEELLSDEAWRYAAECRRLARLARNKSHKVSPRAAVPAMQLGEWLGQFRTQYLDPPAHHVLVRHSTR